jgi:hypothetical protein
MKPEIDDEFLRRCCLATSALYARLAQPDIPFDLAQELLRTSALAILAALDGDSQSVLALFAKGDALIDAWNRSKVPN